MTKYIEVKPGGRRYAYDDAFAKANPGLKVVDLDEIEQKQEPQPNFDDMKASALRAEVKKRGGEYKNRQQALDFLNDVS